MRKTLLSFFTKAIIVSAFVLLSQSATAQIFQFNFENTSVVTTDNAVGTPTFVANGVTAGGYDTTTPCQGLRMISSSNWDTGDSYQFTVNTTGYANMTFSFCDRTDATTVNQFLVRVSSDAGATWTTVLTAFTPAVANTSARTTGTFPTSANNQDEVLIQIYKTNNANANGRDYLIDTATLTGSPIPTVTSFTPTTNCVGTSFTITGTNFTGATAVQINGVAVASFNIVSATSITAIVASGNTTGLVTVSNANGSGSSATNLTVNPAPSSVTATPSATTICSGGTINLTSSANSNSALSTPVTLISENFNAANSWVKTNTSTGGTTADAAWTLRADGYSYTDSNSAVNVWHSNDNTQFYLTNSDDQGAGTTTTSLAVPTFSTVGVASATLSYYQHYRTFTGQTGIVEISNNGSTWVTLVTTPATTQGSITGFVQVNAAIPAGNINQATVFIRFRFNSPFGWWWAIDNLSVTGISTTPPAPTYAWTSVPAGFTSSLQNPTGVAPTVNTVYTVTATNSYGCTTNASTVSVTVNAPSFAGAVSANQSICTGTQPANITIGVSTGTIQWQSSTDNITFTNIGGQTTNTLAGATIGNLTATRYYRAVITNGVCVAANSGVVTVTVSPTSVAGSVSANQTICSGSQPGNITIGASTGTFQWQSSTDNITFNNIGGQTTNTLAGATIGNLTATRYYRAVVTSGGCAAVNSAVVTVTVNPTSVAGSVSANQTICSGSQPGNITIGASTGTFQWQSSTDNITFNNIGGQTTNTLAGATIGNLTATRYYRAVVTSGGCAAVNSAVVTVTVNPTSVAGSVSANQTICSGSQPSDITIGAGTGTIQWQSSTDNIAFNNIGGQTTTTLAGATIGNLTATRFYRAVVTSGVCAAVNSAVVTVTVNPTSVAGSVSSNQTICSGSQPSDITIGAGTGTIQWQSSTDNITFNNIGGQTTNTLAGATIGNLTATRYYRAVVTSGGCAAVNSTVVTVTVNPTSVAGSVSANQIICSGSQPSDITIGAGTGTIQWQSSTDNITFNNIGGQTTNTLAGATIGNLTATRFYRAVVTSGVCAAVNSAVVTVTVNPTSVAGSVSANQTICSGSQPSDITIGAGTGTIQWQSSTDNITFNNIGGQTTNTLAGATIGNLTATRFYRAVVTSGVCAAVNSAVVTVTVNPTSVGGTVTTSATVCSGTNGGTLTLAGHTGNIIRWESSTDNFATANTIVNTTTTQSYSNLTATTSYRAVVQSGVCASANSVAATITVDAVSVGGTVTTSATVCSGTNGGTLTLAGHTGNIIRWESSTDNFTTANTIVNTTTTQSYNNLTATTSYRAVVQSGVCSSANSVAATITVDAVSVGGTVTTSATVCSGTNGGTLTLAGHTGNIIRWESSTDNFTTANTIVNTTTTQSYSNLTATTSYRAVVQSGVCASANSVAATITVDAVSVGGTVSGSTTVCATSNSGSLTLSGNTGNVVKWQSSDFSDFSAAVLDIPNTSNTLSYLNISGTTYYRAVITSGVCSSTFSSVATITVDPAAVGGSVSGSTSVCYGNNNGALNLSGYTGSISGWESSLDNFATAGTPIVNTTATLNYTNLTVTTSYRAIIAGGTCASTTSSSATVTVDDSTTWIGTNSTSWNDAGNWSCGVIPTTDVDVTITAVMNQPIVAADSFAHTLTLQTGTTLTVQTGSALTVVDVIDGQGTSVLTVENDAHVIQVNDVNNNGNAVVKRDSNPLKRLDYTLWSSPVTGSQTLLNFSPLTIATRFYVYNPGTNLYNSTATGGNFAEGKGYLIRTPDNHPTTPTVYNGSFNGTLNNGDLNIPVTTNTYNAIGNPYPSSIDADTFIMQNNLSEALYFWRKTNNDATTSYATYTLAGGVGTNPNNGGDLSLLVPDGIIQPGQGFIAKSTSTTLSFDNAMRIGNNGQFFRNQIERNRIWVNLTNAEGIFSQTMVSYMTGATNGLDAAIDGLYFNDSQLALNSMIGNTEYAIQGRSLPFDNTDVVPLGFKAITAGSYTIGLDHADGLFADVAQDIFLKDNSDNSTHDLRAGSYTFATEAGTFNSRFEIVYQTTLAVTNPIWDANQVIVYKQGHDLIINSGKQTMANVKVFDIRGRLLVEKDNINTSETKLYAGTTNQVLIVKITSIDNKQVTKKVIN